MRSSCCGQRDPAPHGSSSSDSTNPAVVVFRDDASIPWLRWLRPGFRHCFVAVRRSGFWIVCDSLAHRTDLSVIREQSAAVLTERYRSLGLTVVQTMTREAPPRLAPLRFFTCVESVKRVLGIHAPCVFTPWQLHQKLAQEKIGSESCA